MYQYHFLDGQQWLQGHEKVSNHFFLAYSSQFNPLPPKNDHQYVTSFLEPWNKVLTDYDFNQLAVPFRPAEVHKAMFQIGSSKAPSPDGIPIIFYQSQWRVVHNKVITSVLAFMNSGYLLKEENKTFITLILKVDSPQSVLDYRPISLCNVIYKIASEVIVNRLKKVIPKLVSGF